MTEVHCPHCGEAFKGPRSPAGHSVEEVRVFGVALTIITCPRMVGWSMVWGDRQ